MRLNGGRCTWSGERRTSATTDRPGVRKSAVDGSACGRLRPTNRDARDGAERIDNCAADVEMNVEVPGGRGTVPGGLRFSYTNRRCNNGHRSTFSPICRNDMRLDSWRFTLS